jgi:hypothetical protein
MVVTMIKQFHASTAWLSIATQPPNTTDGINECASLASANVDRNVIHRSLLAVVGSVYSKRGKLIYVFCYFVFLSCQNGFRRRSIFLKKKLDISPID